MELQLANHSSYPRIGHGPEGQHLRCTIALREKGEETNQDVRTAEDQMTQMALDDQEGAGLDVVIDGLIRWYNPASHPAGKLAGGHVNGLLRIFGTNPYFRQPAVGVEIEQAAQVNNPVEGYPKAPVDASTKIIHIAEPATSVRPQELPMAIEDMHRVTENSQVYVISHICYGAFEFIHPQMLDIAVDNFDLELSNSGLDMLELFKKDKYTKDISFGPVDMHTHTIEDEPVVKQRLRDALAVIPRENVWGDPNCDLKIRSVDEPVSKMKVTGRLPKL